MSSYRTTKLGCLIDFLIDDDKVLICDKVLATAKTQSWHSVCLKYAKNCSFGEPILFFLSLTSNLRISRHSFISNQPGRNASEFWLQEGIMYSIYWCRISFSLYRMIDWLIDWLFASTLCFFSIQGLPAMKIPRRLSLKWMKSSPSMRPVSVQPYSIQTRKSTFTRWIRTGQGLWTTCITRSTAVLTVVMAYCATRHRRWFCRGRFHTPSW